MSATISAGSCHRVARSVGRAIKRAIGDTMGSTMSSKDRTVGGNLGGMFKAKGDRSNSSKMCHGGAGRFRRGHEQRHRRRRRHREVRGRGTGRGVLALCREGAKKEVGNVVVTISNKVLTDKVKLKALILDVFKTIKRVDSLIANKAYFVTIKTLAKIKLLTNNVGGLNGLRHFRGCVSALKGRACYGFRRLSTTMGGPIGFIGGSVGGVVSSE